MELTIVKKMQNERTRNDGTTFISRSLFVSFTDTKLFQSICDYLISIGASTEQIDKFILENQYHDTDTFYFGLNCTEKTWQIVEAFATLDAKILFTINGNYINAKIAEKGINKYTPAVEQDDWGIAMPQAKEESSPATDMPEATMLNNPNLPF